MPDNHSPTIQPDTTVPAGMVVVTKEEFFSALKAEKRDIMPSVEESPDYSVWQTWDRKVFGRSYPGWKNGGYPEGHPLGKKTYMLAKS